MIDLIPVAAIRPYWAERGTEIIYDLSNPQECQDLIEEMKLLCTAGMDETEDTALGLCRNSSSNPRVFGLTA